MKLSRAVLLFVSLGLSGWDAAQARDLTFEERVAAQRAIEQVYWRHRIWPEGSRRFKPAFDETVSETTLRSKVVRYLEESNALDKVWGRPIQAGDLQAEMDRMAVGTRDPGMLQELFTALGNDPFLIAETLARPALADRFARDAYASEVPEDEAFVVGKMPFDAWWSEERESFGVAVEAPSGAYTLAAVAQGGCTNDTWSPTRFETPDPRDYHTAVWTGTEMIVWGGSNGRTDFNTGGRFDPATDTWTPTSMGPNLPAPRKTHTAVWTGTEMIVWGGTIDGIPLATGGRYNPTTDTWSATTMAGVPSVRSQHTAVWTGTRMIVWGGLSGVGFLGTGALYDPSTNSWAPTASGGAPSPRELHSAVWTGQEMVVWGGDNGALLNTGGRYDPVANVWAATSTGADVPSGRYFHSAVWSGTEMIVWGGTDGAVLNTGSRYDPRTDTWKATSTGEHVPAGRSYHSAVWTGTEMIVWGGWGGAGYFSTGARYDPNGDVWLPTPAGAGVPAPRELHTVVWTGTEMIVWGGTSGNVLNTGGRYAPAASSWKGTSTGATVATARAYHTAVWTGAEMIVWGGDDGASLTGTGSRYSPATDTWSPTSTGTDVPAARYQHTAIWTGTEMIVWGGWSSGYLGNGGRYDPASDTWTGVSTGANAPIARYLHTAVWDPVGGRMIVWGGYNGGPLGTGGIYSPSTNSWTTISTGANVPAGRFRHSAVFTGSEMIVWGGWNTAYLNTGGRYNPATDTWTATPTAAASPARAYHTAVWTGTEMIVWGGWDGTYLRTGARYKPSTQTWAATSIAGAAPSARMFHTAVWTGSEMIVWAGLGASPGYFRTGGRYNPSTDQWTATSTGTGVPAVRDYHVAVWTGSQMVVWGGSGGSGYLCSGGLYCACLAPGTYYRDADGDGYGVSTDTVVSCAQPLGYAITVGDCDDADPRTHPHAHEFKDGRDNQCPTDCPGGACGFGVIDEVTGPLVWSSAMLCWVAQPGATEYQVVRSSGAAFTSGCATLATTASTCVADPANPGPGTGYSYLVRSSSPAPAGSYGQRSSGVARSGGCLPP